MAPITGWHELLQTLEEPEPDNRPRRRPIKCDLCGRFTRTLTPVYCGEYDSELDYCVGDCCRNT